MQQHFVKHRSIRQYALQLWLGLFTLLCSASLVGITLGWWPGVPVHSNIMELLPALRDDAVLRDALARSNQAVSRQLVILVGHRDAAATARAANIVSESVLAQNFFRQNNHDPSREKAATDNTQPAAIGRFYFPWRSVLLANAQRQHITEQQWDALQQQLTQVVFSPMGGVNADLLASDPLLTFYHFLRGLPAAPGKLLWRDGAITVRGEDRDYRVITATLSQDTFDMQFHPHYTAWRDGLLAQLHQQTPDTEVLLMGAVQHAVWGAASAKHEVSTIGNGSLAGIILLIFLVFRGGRPLFASLLPLGAGVLGGLVATLLAFGHVHLITLVFGSSVIGVAMDYALHYLCEQCSHLQEQGRHAEQHHQQHQQQQHSLKQVFAGITLAMLTSVIAYAAIGFAPFPVLRQVALFSCVGLFTAWLTVVALFPRLLPAQQFRHARYLRWSAQLDHGLRHVFDRPISRVLLALAALALLPGVLSLRANDDLRLLQAPEPGIRAADQRVQALTGIAPDGRFFLIEGQNTEQLLARSEQLDAAVRHQLPGASTDLLSAYVPSIARQQENLVLTQQLLHSDFARQWQDTLGLPDTVMQRARDNAANPPLQWLTPALASASSLASLTERFLLHETGSQNNGRGVIAAGFLRKVNDSAAAKNLAASLPGVHWMDPVADISELFRHYRLQTAWMMLAAYGVIAALLVWRYGWRRAPRVMLAPALAAWFALGVLGHAGIAINLFHVLALLLVLGVGIDYSIFFAETTTHRAPTMLAVVLSTFTTLLSFGLLALSDTAAIRSFGTVVSIGMVCALLFAPLAQSHTAQAQR